MMTSTAAVLIFGNLPERLEAIASVGFDGIEICERDLIAVTARPKTFKPLPNASVRIAPRKRLIRPK